MASSRKSDNAPLGSVSICGIDPGKPPKTCFASRLAERGTERAPGWWVQRTPLVSAHDLVIAERPGKVIWTGRSPDSVISPAGWGMAALFSVPTTPGGMRCWVPTEDWKRKLLGSAWNMKKENACRNFVEMFKLKGLDPTVDADQDEIDSVAIAHAGQLFTRKDLKKWQVAW